VATRSYITEINGKPIAAERAEYAEKDIYGHSIALTVSEYGEIARIGNMAVSAGRAHTDANGNDLTLGINESDTVCNIGGRAIEVPRITDEDINELR